MHVKFKLWRQKYQSNEIAIIRKIKEENPGAGFYDPEYVFLHLDLKGKLGIDFSHEGSSGSRKYKISCSNKIMIRRKLIENALTNQDSVTHSDLKWSFVRILTSIEFPVAVQHFKLCPD